MSCGFNLARICRRMLTLLLLCPSPLVAFVVAWCRPSASLVACAQVPAGLHGAVHAAAGRHHPHPPRASRRAGRRRALPAQGLLRHLLRDPPGPHLPLPHGLLDQPHRRTDHGRNRRGGCVCVFFLFLIPACSTGLACRHYRLFSCDLSTAFLSLLHIYAQVDFADMDSMWKRATALGLQNKPLEVILA